MEEDKEKFFDYSRGLNAPYWIQEIKTAKGKLIWYFSTPMQLSFFIVFFVILVLLLTVFSPLMMALNSMTHSISMFLYWLYLTDCQNSIQNMSPKERKCTYTYGII